jgi:hypothetical protein
VRAALKGVNAVVVGLLLGALYTPVWTSSIFTAKDFGLATLAFLLLVVTVTIQTPYAMGLQARALTDEEKAP